jgi:large subunit ribosomal protein L4
MAQFAVYDLSKNEVGSIDLNDSVFGAEVKTHLLWEVVKAQLANRRRGTAATKTRAVVRGGGKKPYRQKGTGRARQGSTVSPILVGGGTAHGPQPRLYTHHTPKKVKAAALRSAVSLRAQGETFFVLKNFDLPAIKTKQVTSILKTFGTAKVLIVEGENDNLQLSARNIPTVKVIRPEGLNVYDLIRYPALIVTEAAAKAVEERLTK